MFKRARTHLLAGTISTVSATCESLWISPATNGTSTRTTLNPFVVPPSGGPPIPKAAVPLAMDFPGITLNV